MNAQALHIPSVVGRVTAALMAVLCLGLPLQDAWAQSFSLHAEASADVIGTDEALTYTVHVEGSSIDHVDAPAPPEASGLAPQDERPTTHRDVSFTDGELRRSVTHTWTYEPTGEGTAHIEPAEVTVDNRLYFTNAVDVSVADTSSPPVFRDPDSDGSSDPDAAPDPLPDLDAALASDDLFIEAELDTDRVYQHEQAVVEYYMYYREGVEIQRNRLAGGRDATGFWQEDLEVDDRPVPTSVTVDGHPYQRFLLRRAALFPTQTGTLEIPGLEVQTEARRLPHDPDRDPRDPEQYDFETEIVTSNAQTLTAEPLPEPAPAGFQGAVGIFDFDLDLDDTTVEIGDEITLTVEIEGHGNLPTLAMPRVLIPESFDVFGPNEDVTLDRSASSISGTKTATYALVAREPGTHLFGPVTFSYFDLEQGAYETLEAEPPAVRVEGDVPVAHDDAPTTGLPSDDIAALMTDAASWQSTSSTPLYQQPWPYAAILLPLLLAGAALAVRRWQDDETATPAPPDAPALLADAREHLDPSTPDPFYDRIERAVVRCIEKHTGSSTGGWTRDRLDTLLDSHDLPPSLRQDLIALLDTCDQARFAPATVDAPTMEQDLSAARRVVGRLTKVLSTTE